MSTAKSMIIDKVNSISDDMDEMKIIERLFWVIIALIAGIYAVIIGGIRIT